MAGVRVANLTKEFAAGRSKVTALDRLNLEINPLELLVVLGPSGCGKTTLLRCIAGLENPTSGEIALGGESLLHKKPQDRRIGMAFQYPALLPQLSVDENISLGPKLRGVSAAERSARTYELADLLEITHLLTRLPESLSGGQQQRVSLARALATRPELLLLDEPLANLDPTSRMQLRDTIRAVQQKLGVTTIYVTHDQDEAAALADRIAIMNEGRVLGIGTAQQLYSDPPNFFVAQFFGPETPNILGGKFDSNGFRANGTNLVFPAMATHAGEARCVIRPRTIRPGAEFAGKIVSIQHSGWSTSFVLATQNLNLRAELPPMGMLRVGDDFSFAIDSADLLFFDASGARLR
jgi:putative spermidine/putrescine transport system ATP-binding protein